MDNLSTLRDYVRYCATQMLKKGVFSGHGTANAFDEAYALVLHVLHLPFDTPEVYLGAHLTADEQTHILAMLQRRVDERMPLPYLMGYARFAGLDFTVTQEVLIPRSPIAELIESQFEPWVEVEQVTQILDLCTGSGCIGIACAYAFPDAHVDITDISYPALAVAKTNIQQHACDGQVKPILSDLFDALDGHKYDLIVSNPPYVSEAEVAALPPEYHKEPVLGLLAGKAGLDVVQRILAQARDHLTAHGVLVVEVGATADVLAETYPNVPFMWFDFEFGGEGVFLLTAEQLDNYADTFSH